MPVTTSADPRPFAAIGTASLQISISARDIKIPLMMPDIRLQAISDSARTIDHSLLAGGVHIRLLGMGGLMAYLSRIMQSLPKAGIARWPAFDCPLEGIGSRHDGLKTSYESHIETLSEVTVYFRGRCVLASVCNG